MGCEVRPRFGDVSANGDSAAAALLLLLLWSSWAKRTHIRCTRKDQRETASQGRENVSNTARVQVVLSGARSLQRERRDIVADPEPYALGVTRFMQTTLEATPALIADLFTGYTPVTTRGPWSDQFHNSAITTRPEGLVTAALQMERDGEPRPADFLSIVKAAARRGLYRD